LRRQRKVFKKEYEVLGPNFDQEIDKMEPRTMEEVYDEAQEMLSHYKVEVIFHFIKVNMRF